MGAENLYITLSYKTVAPKNVVEIDTMVGDEMCDVIGIFSL